MLVFVSVSAKAGFLTPVYQKMVADGKKVEYAKSHSPIKTIEYNGTFIYSSITGQYSPWSGTEALSFYSNDVIKFCNEYFIKSQEEGDATVYRLPSGDKKYESCAVFVLNCGEINFVNGIMMFNYSRNGANQNLKPMIEGQASMGMSNFSNNNSSSSSSSSSSGGIQCRSCNGTGKCTMCNGNGRYWVQTGIYIGKDIKEYTDCAGCHATGNCQVCHGQGSIR